MKKVSKPKAYTDMLQKEKKTKAQVGRQTSGVYDFSNTYTGPDRTSPGVLKAKADKKKVNTNVSAYKKKAQAQKQLALRKAIPQDKPKNLALKNVNMPKKGKPGYSTKTVFKGKAYNEKGDLIEKYDVSSKKGVRNMYYTSANGEPTKSVYNPKTATSTKSVMDTTGYSKGRKDFKVVTETSKGKGKPKVTTKKVSRSNVQNELGKMQNFKKGGKLHLGFKETQAKIAKKQGISMEAAGAILASSARKASPKAKAKNPALKNVKMPKKK